MGIWHGRNGRELARIVVVAGCLIDPSRAPGLPIALPYSTISHSSKSERNDIDASQGGTRYSSAAPCNLKRQLAPVCSRAVLGFLTSLGKAPPYLNESLRLRSTKTPAMPVQHGTQRCRPAALEAADESPVCHVREPHSLLRIDGCRCGKESAGRSAGHSGVQSLNAFQVVQPVVILAD